MDTGIASNIFEETTSTQGTIEVVVILCINVTSFTVICIQNLNKYKVLNHKMVVLILLKNLQALKTLHSISERFI